MIDPAEKKRREDAVKPLLASVGRDLPGLAPIMESVVSRYISGETDSLGMAKPPIDPAGKEKRKKAVDYARASVELEGFTLTPEDEAAARRFVDGEIDLQEFVSGTRKQAEK